MASNVKINFGAVKILCRMKSSLQRCGSFNNGFRCLASTHTFVTKPITHTIVDTCELNVPKWKSVGVKNSEIETETKIHHLYGYTRSNRFLNSAWHFCHTVRQTHTSADNTVSENPSSDTIDLNVSTETSESDTESFASMLRRSKLMQIGDPDGRVVVGTIFEVVGDDLYIDFGGKFHCVCERPQVRASDYFRGVKVKLRLHDFEMSSKFLGSDKHVTLLEGDATLIGLYSS